jgi:hypothetical protein
MSKSFPEFNSLLFKIMVGPSKKQKCLSDEELSELLYNCEVSDILESEFSDDSYTNVGMTSGSEQRENSDDEDNANNSSDMQHNTWTWVGAERPHLPFSGKPGINVDLEDQNNPHCLSGNSYQWHMYSK